MFRTLANASFRRSLHTTSRHTASARPGRLRVVLGASAVATSYFIWNSWYGQRIALDSASPSSKQVPPTPKASASPEVTIQSSSTAPQDEPPIASELHSSSDAPPDEPNSEPTAESGEESAGGGGAFNPETGEINWDCSCLGGMAHGPCGMQFREAFSCFVYSEADPKGIDCVEKFKVMQECFREHPDVYGDDIMNDDEDEEGFAPDTAPASDAAEPPREQETALFEPSEPAPVPTEQKGKPERIPTATTP